MVDAGPRSARPFGSWSSLGDQIDQALLTKVLADIREKQRCGSGRYSGSRFPDSAA